ncbi:MAG: pilus assembly protein [Actinobacteria bacterium]|nr:pilus assembly protein [Actinomycetota bacterium]
MSERSVTRRMRGDGGAAVVEAAFAMPLVLSLVMALIDFGFVELKTSQLSSAARDGARKGIVTSYTTAAGSVSGGAACPSTSSDFASICTAARSRLAGTSLDSITVQCRQGISTTPMACGSAVRGVDSIYVSVSLTHSPLTIIGRTFIGNTKTYFSSAQMML